MSQWRDARLQRALQSAPDDDTRPPPAVQRAILEAAHGAVAPAPPVRASRWRTWWSAGGSARPWNAAFASLLLAGVITLLWRHEEVPPAQGDKAVPAAAPAQNAASAPVAPAPEPAAGPGPARPAEPVATERRAASVRPQPQPPVAMAAVPAPAPPAQAPVRDAPLAESPRSDAVGALANAAPTPVAPRAAAAARAAPDVRAKSEAAAGSSGSASTPFPDWDALRIAQGTRTGIWPKSDAGRLDPLLQRALVPGDGDGLPGGAELRLDLLREGRLLGVLEIAADVLRWQPAGGAAVVRRDAGLAAELRRAIEALPQRP